MRTRHKVIASAGLLLAGLIWMGNTPRFTPSRTGTPSILVHRGMAQQFDASSPWTDRCDAAHIVPPVHSFLENTIPSMEAAFAGGAGVVEFDVQLTRENQFAVFHDRRLECRTNGRGLVRDHTMTELKSLDVGYGYTADGGRTYPLRGSGIGLMPSMTEIFERFPDKSFLIDIKGDSPEAGPLLAQHLSKLTSDHRSRLMVFGTERVLADLAAVLGEVRSFSATSIQNCLLRYIAMGWTGMVPGSCRNSALFVPVNVTTFLWGWPNRFIERMEAAQSTVIVMGDFGNGEISPGLDSMEDLERLPLDYDGGIWTNDVELLAKFLSNRRKGVSP
jgi:glycerophosphoryl diester phosphodiesterase